MVTIDFKVIACFAAWTLSQPFSQDASQPSTEITVEGLLPCYGAAQEAAL
jgi:hypothetical protein